MEAGLVRSMADDFHQRWAGACGRGLNHARLGNRVKKREQHGQQGRGLDGRHNRQAGDGRQITVAEIECPSNSVTTQSP